VTNSDPRGESVSDGGPGAATGSPLRRCLHPVLAEEPRSGDSDNRGEVETAPCEEPSPIWPVERAGA
jgi:hypothetical protein